MKPINKILVILILCFIFLTACGNGGNDGEESSSIKITSYSVEGTSPASDGVVPINSIVNDGVFKVSWSVSSDDIYHIELYLSNDDELSRDTDVDFFGRNCGSISTACKQNGSVDCRFTTQNKISCGTISIYNPEKDITPFLDQIPKAAYLIMEACNALFDSCETASVQVELQ
ncbi:MAG: hypothetical protein VST71_06725 [Nitrospirota bacterium]|nr:hypothetical protein [Nitrospirota bacterium]